MGRLAQELEALHQELIKEKSSSQYQHSPNLRSGLQVAISIVGRRLDAARRKGL